MDHQQIYLKHLNDLNRDASITHLLDCLDQRMITLEEAYHWVATSLGLTVEAVNHDVWQEHAKTQIVRTSLEVLTPYLLKQAPKLNGKRIAVVCPEGEYHELGARLVSDQIRLLGVEALYLGNSLPKHELLALVEEAKLDGLAMSVSNFYALSQVNAVIADINAKQANLPILLGGLAIHHNSASLHGQNLHLCLTLEELKTVVEGLK